VKKIIIGVMKMAGKFDEWFGVPRKEIKWYPTIDPAACVGCGLCFVTCGRNVYSYDLNSKKPIVANPYNCLVGCTTCANICPVGAINFPSLEVVHEAIKKNKIMAKVKDLVPTKVEFMQEQQHESDIANKAK